ncbi:ABC transporter ATP-binding protein [Rhizobium leguminosarum]|uniref:ABC transporter ATP-binding protein n=1 Tax=Rhizobium leguminosarum TaxID=384 RepID=UPI0010408921|nr:ABC transporter ATP-binding protein [Rhizobium leguminosarum]TBY24084.1 ABC transporter ATP-binding protein [Rhizobium leguminosarum bv. viciae]TBY34772.1 ABC transporter ATP-binding protein [Rhizobium leguminosarum bv. viciae]TBY93536.1 ABC transporter ATP-binding protein [Rhizobium leguminosarum bv. viciae]
MRLEERRRNGAVIAARLEGLTKRYPNGTLAIDRMDLTVGKGEFVSLLGPTGCGKSTALYILAGLANATAGRVELAGDGRQAVGAGSIGFVFQEPSLMPWATVSENVALPLTLRGSAVDLACEVIRCLTMVGLETFADAYPRELSGGMKMRVSIARALITRPQLLLLDEPFGALDEITRARLHDDLLRIWRETGCTIVMVTHSTTESVYLSNRVVVMAARPGRIIGSVDVSEPYPRTNAFRLGPGFSDHVGQVSALMDHASSGEFI